MAPEVIEQNALEPKNQQQEGGESSDENKSSSSGRNDSTRILIGYGRKADVWSFGISCLEMVSGTPPFKNGPSAIYSICVLREIPLLQSLNSSPLIDPPLRDETIDFLKSCMNFDPELRMDSNNLCYHEIFDSFERDEDELSGGKVKDHLNVSDSKGENERKKKKEKKELKAIKQVRIQLDINEEYENHDVDDEKKEKKTKAGTNYHFSLSKNGQKVSA